ncbi:VRR-NUC domain-containing protein [Azospirillum aestuarii]|uniref:VRR-NUC domain-containing protein n=1 Tax=Azospirillum aestuarii TaxID=2802052 RepID=UPI0040552F22
MKETPILRSILLALGARPDARLFRNNVGTGWAGQVVRFSAPSTVRVGPGDVVVRNARPLHAGLCVGSSDLIGLTTITITPEMAGRSIAVFTAVEVKAARGRSTEDQRAFVSMVTQRGGIAGVARSPEEAAALLAAGPGRAPAEGRGP